VVPWFLRRGHIHVEHGHVFDPHNAPQHPLADFAADTEPQGAALMRRFIVRSGAGAFAHAHETTPVQGILRAFRIYGARAPVMIAIYFREAFRLCWEASSVRGVQRELAFLQGRDRLAGAALEQEVAVELLQALWAVAPRPTHADAWPLFRRLYFDAVFAGIGATAGAARFLSSPHPVSLVGALLCAGYLWRESPRGRYAGRPCLDLAQGAHQVARVMDASRVVFGHTHVTADDGPYLNPGSFTYANGPRCYVRLLDDTHADLAQL
jgi:hypothetical protein